MLGEIVGSRNGMADPIALVVTGSRFNKKCKAEPAASRGL